MTNPFLPFFYLFKMLLLVNRSLWFVWLSYGTRIKRCVLCYVWKWPLINNCHLWHLTNAFNSTYGWELLIVIAREGSNSQYLENNVLYIIFGIARYTFDNPFILQILYNFKSKPFMYQKLGYKLYKHVPPTMEFNSLKIMQCA